MTVQCDPFATANIDFDFAFTIVVDVVNGMRPVKILLNSASSNRKPFTRRRTWPNR